MPYSDLSFHLCVRACVRPVRKKWLSPFYSTKVRYIHQTYNNCSSWHDLLMPLGGLCPWPTFHTWVTMVRKKWLSLYFSTYWCYIYQTCTNCSYWHYLLMQPGGLCPWRTFHAWVTMVGRYGQVYFTVPIGATFTKLAPTAHLDMIYWCHMVVCILDLQFLLQQWPRHKMAIQ